jgi:OmcA/MtrC family decaheme c-type cytochrome
VVCHNGNTARNGATHQAAYDELYQDNVVQVTNLTYAFNPVDNTDVVTFNMTKAGAPLDCRETNTSPNSLNIYFVPFDGTDFQFGGGLGRLSIKGSGATGLTYAAGTNLCTSTAARGAAYLALGDLSTNDGLIVVFGRDEALTADQASPELRFTRVSQNKYPFAALIETGAGVAYTSPATVSGCEKCHTIPFLKHGYIYGRTGGDPATDFYTCKACHLDDGEGGHFEWQLAVDDPPLWAAYNAGSGTPLDNAQKAKYAYRTTLMNDVHMSHAMEFPYPQSMSNCVVCHAGKLGVVLTDNNFVVETCKSCHAVTGPADYPDTKPQTFYAKKAPPLSVILPAGVGAHNPPFATACNVCHSAAGGAPLFNTIHNGYDQTIYSDAAGTKYSSIFVATIDNASIDNANLLTIGFSATGSANGLTADNVVPTVLVGLYGWDTKDYIVGPHDRDIDTSRNLEIAFGTTHPRMTITSTGSGTWRATANLAAWDNLIANGTVRKAEIAVMPRLVNPALNSGDNVVALNAPSRTFNLKTNAFVANYYSGTNEIVSVSAGCNNCHDALADTFHSPDRGGNIVVCRLCHITKDPGSHLEMQSRSIDSYAHSIHTFQLFDINTVNFNDPVEALHAEEHQRFAFPTLGRTNCVSCHKVGKFNVPDQAKSMPGLLSGSESHATLAANGFDRNIGDIPEYVTGPASRACGGCHRGNFIVTDDAVGLAAFYSHTSRPNGYLVENDANDTVRDQVINDIMAFFYP